MGVKTGTAGDGVGVGVCAVGGFCQADAVPGRTIVAAIADRAELTRNSRRLIDRKSPAEKSNPEPAAWLARV